MRSITKVVLACIVLISSIAFAQEDESRLAIQIPDRVFAADIYLQRAFPSGDNFVGNGLASGTGFGIRLQSDVYKNIYVGGALTQDYFDVKDVQEIGQFDRATKFNAYLFAGYDYVLNDDWNFTADLGYGYSQNKNKQGFEQGGGTFRDTGNLLRLTTSTEYALSNGISVYLSPSYEKVFYKIETAPALGDHFNVGNYFNLAIGFRFNVRDYNSMDSTTSYDQEIMELQSRDRDDLSIKEKRKLYFLKKKAARKARREHRNNN
ncbi:porin family protein [Nonlabens agnitus]|uniref:Outer membrane protein beta-barrel domain-containing protein n=1 Tax=Nonlabens agnitus TaxID=870484 RepID=A0A2S9WT78_9FLAO|nr:porin family protein [Nonlabens agnitus]PRP66678.1 hypothetical protein BST86_05955 [Nonlabens agnitus]